MNQIIVLILDKVNPTKYKIQFLNDHFKGKSYSKLPGSM